MSTLSPYKFDRFFFKYPSGKTLFEDFSLPIPQHQWLGILGPSGVGKSTLLHGIAKQIQAQSALKIAFLAQSSTLLPWMTIIQNVQVGDFLRGTRHGKNEAKAQTLLHKMGLAGHEQKKPYQLSGGQCQRAIIARTIYEASDVVFMDEPFASLDAITKQEIQDCAQQSFSEKTVILVTHDPLEALRLCDHIIVLQGQPVTYRGVLQLHSSKPRKVTNNEVVEHYESLMTKLQLAKNEEN